MQMDLSQLELNTVAMKSLDLSVLGYHFSGVRAIQNDKCRWCTYKFRNEILKYTLVIYAEWYLEPNSINLRGLNFLVSINREDGNSMTLIKKEALICDGQRYNTLPVREAVDLFIRDFQEESQTLFRQELTGEYWKSNMTWPEIHEQYFQFYDAQKQILFGDQPNAEENRAPAKNGRFEGVKNSLSRLLRRILRR